MWLHWFLVRSRNMEDRKIEWPQPSMSSKLDIISMMKASGLIKTLTSVFCAVCWDNLQPPGYSGEIWGIVSLLSASWWREQSSLLTATSAPSLAHHWVDYGYLLAVWWSDSTPHHAKYPEKITMVQNHCTRWKEVWYTLLYKITISRMEAGDGWNHAAWREHAHVHIMSFMRSFIHSIIYIILERRRHENHLLWVYLVTR